MESIYDMELGDDLDEGPSEEDMRRQEEERQERLNLLGMALAESRSKAMNDRSNSGIEAEWTEDREFYEGIDDANRSDMESKPPGQAQPDDTSGSGSKIFINITRPYCDAAAARTCDMLLPTDDRAWELGATPIPDLIKIAKGEIPSDINSQIDKEIPDPEAAGQEKAKLIAESKKVVNAAAEKAKKAEVRIDDWLTECQFTTHIRHAVDDTAQIGTGVLKGPVPERHVKLAYLNGELVTNKEIKPASRRIDPWNFFPDGSCGQNIHDGGFTWERDDISKKALSELKDDPGYIMEQIDACLEEGAHVAVKQYNREAGSNGTVARDTKDLFEIWYYHGQLQKEDLEAAQCDCSEAEKNKIYHAQITMVNNRVIKAVLNPIETGDFPYDLIVWQRREGMPWGKGISSQIRAPQRIVNGATRIMMDNAGVGGSPMLVLKQGIITPANGVVEIRGGKIWFANETATDAEIEKAILFLKMDMVQDALQGIIFFGLRLCEDVTGMPLIMQGQQQSKAPEAVGSMEIRNNNAGTVMRRVARLFDDLLSKPHINRYYKYLLLYGPDDEEKGDFVVEARGSTVLVDRDLERQAIMEMSSIVEKPQFGVDPKKWFAEWLRSRRLRPADFQYDDENWQKVVEGLSQPPQDNRVAIAQLNADNAQILKDKDIEHKEKMADRDRELTAAIKDVETMLTQDKQDGDHTISIEEIRERIISLREKLDLQEKLSTEVAKPPTEPAGRAKNGESYQS